MALEEAEDFKVCSLETKQRQKKKKEKSILRLFHEGKKTLCTKKYIEFVLSL